MKAKERRIDLTEGSLLSGMLALAIPVIINSFIQSIYNLTDTFWLGRLGTNQLAAINLVSPVQNIVQNFGSGLTVAGAVLISQYVGAKKLKEAKSMANQIYACAMIFATTCAVTIALLSPFLVRWLGAEGETFRHARIYLSLVILDMPFLFTVNMFQSINQAQGDTVTPMILNFLGICINLIADPLLMIVLNWGAAGAALATVFAKMVPAIVALTKLTDQERTIHINFRGLKFEKDKLKNILIIGFPTALGGSTMQLGFLLMSKSVYVYGTSAMAAYGVANKVNGFITLPSNGIGSAVSTIVGQNIGAKKLDRANKGYHVAMYCSVGFLLLAGFVLSRVTVSEAAVGIFTQDPEVISMAGDFLRVMAFWCFANGVYNSTMGLFQGSGHTEVTMLVDASRLWIFRFATLFVCENILHMGLRSVWYSVVVSNGISAVILFMVYLTGYWKKPRMSASETRKAKAAKIVYSEDNKDED